MPRHGGKHIVLVKGAEEAMRAFRMEIAEDLGLGEKLGEGEDTFKNFTTVEVGTIGGEMVRRLQAMGENVVKERYAKNEKRLLPDELMPQTKSVRSVSNNGNPQGEISGKQSDGKTSTQGAQQTNTTPGPLPKAAVRQTGSSDTTFGLVK
jgi:hypothetical protein